MRILILFIFCYPAFGQLPTTGTLSIKTAAGSGRSISQEVDGNITGSKSLSTLSGTAGKSAPHSMLEFYGYEAVLSPPGGLAPFSWIVQLASPAGTNGIELAWGAPMSGGTPTHYRLEFQSRSDLGDPWDPWDFLQNVTHPTRDAVMPHSALTLNNHYRFRVRAENSAGVGSWSTYSPLGNGILYSAP